MMSSRASLITLLTIHLAVGVIALDGAENVEKVCAGKEFRLLVHSSFSTVTFAPDNDGPKRVLLEGTLVQDSRFTWNRHMELVLKDVTHSDQGLYAIKLFTGRTYETVRLIVIACVKSYTRKYGENFQQNIPENGALLDFTPRGAPSEAMPVVLWNRTNPETSNVGRGRLQAGKVWVAERVTQVDQGNYTVKDMQGKVLSRSTLTVRGHSFKVTHHANESLKLPLFLPYHHVHLIFTPTQRPDEFYLIDPKPHPRGPVHLIHEGQITDNEMGHWGIIFSSRNGNISEVVIAKLTSRHDGVYEIRDGDGNLVSSTSLHVIVPPKMSRWRALLKSISVPSGMFVSLTGVILFLKRYPFCRVSRPTTGLRVNSTPPANPPRVDIQDYSRPAHDHSRHIYSHSQHPGTPRKWTPRGSPTHIGYTPVTVGEPRAESQGTPRLTTGSAPVHHSATERDICNEEEKNISFSVPGASDCLHSSEDCAEFKIKKDGDKTRRNKLQNYFSTLPLDTNTSESCCVYTSEKLNFS